MLKIKACFLDIVIPLFDKAGNIHWPCPALTKLQTLAPSYSDSVKVKRSALLFAVVMARNKVLAWYKILVLIKWAIWGSHKLLSGAPSKQTHLVRSPRPLQGWSKPQNVQREKVSPFWRCFCSGAVPNSSSSHLDGWRGAAGSLLAIEVAGHILDGYFWFCSNQGGWVHLLA